MPINETGHARNVERFQSLISFVTAYGAAYDPSNTDISLTALGTVLTAAQTAIDGVAAKLALNKSAVNDREISFGPLRKLGTRVVNYYASTGTEPAKLDDAKAIKRKLDGGRVKAVVPDDPNTPEDESLVNHSASQQSYTQLVEHLDGLIALLGNDTLYQPNETDLKLVQLTTLSTTLRSLNGAVIDSVTALSNARNTRNQALYDADNSLVNTALHVKQYVKATFGAASPEYKQVSGLEFTRPRE